MTIKSIVERMREGNMTPDEIADSRVFIGTWLYTFNVRYGKASALSAVWITANREKYKSHAECERAWEATEKGQEEIRLKYDIRALEAIQDALETAWFLAQREWKNV